MSIFVLPLYTLSELVPFTGNRDKVRLPLSVGFLTIPTSRIGIVYTVPGFISMLAGLSALHAVRLVSG